MKRTREREIVHDSERVAMPLELLGVIAQQYTADSVRDIFHFGLLCRAAQSSVHLFLQGWIDSLCKEVSDTRGRIRNEKMIVEAEILSKYLLEQHTSFRKFNILWYNQKQRLTGPTKEFLLGCLDLMREALMQRRLIQKNKVKQEEYFTTSMKLDGLFYHDQERGVVVPVKKVPGLKMVKVPQPGVMTSELEIMISENTVHPIAEMALKTLWKLHGPKLRSTYYHTCKSLGKPLKLHKPHKKSLLYNAVVGENHLFSTALESATTRSNLYSCQPLKRKGITTEFVILLYVTRKERFGRIRDVLGL